MVRKRAAWASLIAAGGARVGGALRIGSRDICGSGSRGGVAAAAREAPVHRSKPAKPSQLLPERAMCAVREGLRRNGSGRMEDSCKERTCRFGRLLPQGAHWLATRFVSGG